MNEELIAIITEEIIRQLGRKSAGEQTSFTALSYGEPLREKDCWLSQQNRCLCRKRENPAFHFEKAVL